MEETERYLQFTEEILKNHDALSIFIFMTMNGSKRDTRHFISDGGEVRGQAEGGERLD